MFSFSQRVRSQDVGASQAMAIPWLCLVILPVASQVVHQWTSQRGGEKDDKACALQADGCRRHFSNFFPMERSLEKSFRCSIVSQFAEQSFFWCLCKVDMSHEVGLNWDHGKVCEPSGALNRGRSSTFWSFAIIVCFRYVFSGFCIPDEIWLMRTIESRIIDWTKHCSRAEDTNLLVENSETVRQCDA